MNDGSFDAQERRKAEPTTQVPSAQKRGRPEESPSRLNTEGSFSPRRNRSWEFKRRLSWEMKSALVFDPSSRIVATVSKPDLEFGEYISLAQFFAAMLIPGKASYTLVKLPRWSNKVDIKIPGVDLTFMTINLECLGWTTNFKRHLGIIREMFIK